MVSNTGSNPTGDKYEAQSMADLKKYGGYIIAVILLALAGYFGWQYWQNRTVSVDTVAADEYAAVQELNDKVNLAKQNPDLEATALEADKAALAEQIDALVATHPNSVYAWQALVLKARQQADAEDYDGASTSLKQALSVANDDAGLKALTQLRYAATLLAAGKVDEALSEASHEVPNAFDATKQELLGDIYLTQGKQEDAIRAYENAWSLLIKREEERAILRLKIESLGVVPEQVPDKPELIASQASTVGSLVTEEVTPEQPVEIDASTVTVQSESTGEAETEEASEIQ
ncbi:YfgM family protein [Psychrobacter sp. I-STPA6b]|uniref:YfgM family protein n=1 Tax=Psychrobacter sp. I-STPA6b TaxID=2585718 RepID=UPI001D0C242D|nr:tetratricopeptide repeat protein [Psychrobacter sp. I-STPA6b]